MIEKQRKIVLKEFYGPGFDIYDDQLGFTKPMYEEARSYVAREAFRFHVESVGLNMAFYYIDNDTFYGIHTEVRPIRVKVLPRDRSLSEYIGFQCESDTYDIPVEVVAIFDEPCEIWDNLRIDGKSLEEVLRRSFITSLT